MLHVSEAFKLNLKVGVAVPAKVNEDPPKTLLLLSPEMPAAKAAAERVTPSSNTNKSPLSEIRHLILSNRHS